MAPLPPWRCAGGAQISTVQLDMFFQLGLLGRLGSSLNFFEYVPANFDQSDQSVSSLKTSKPQFLQDMKVVSVDLKARRATVTVQERCATDLSNMRLFGRIFLICVYSF